MSARRPARESADLARLAKMLDVADVARLDQGMACVVSLAKCAITYYWTLVDAGIPRIAAKEMLLQWHDAAVSATSPGEDVE